MPRPRDPRRDKAFEIWKNSSGAKQLKEIAAELGVSDSQIRKWKYQDTWDTHLNGNVTKQTKSNVTKRGAPKGSKNARGNKGGKAPPGNQNAKGNKGGYPPSGNKNAVRTGEYETLFWDFLDEDERVLFDEIETDPLYQIDLTIRELSLRERRMMKRIAKIESGLTEKQRRVLQQMRKVKDVIQTHNEKTGATKSVPVSQEKLVTVEVEETELRAIEDILSIEEAITRITDKRLKAIKQKHEMSSLILQQELKVEQLKIGIEKAKAEVEKLTSKNDDKPVEIVIKRGVKKNG